MQQVVSIYTVNVLTAAIALSEVDDVRPVLDYYKQQGEENILNTFKTIQAKVQEEEESLQRYRTNHLAHGSSVGRVSSFNRRKKATKASSASVSVKLLFAWARCCAIYQSCSIQSNVQYTVKCDACTITRGYPFTM